MENELRPCPFCGGEPELLGKRAFYVWCDKCETRGDYYNTEAEAIEAWNTRAEMSYKDTLILLDELGLSERTCEVEYISGGYGIGGWYCLTCGGYMHDDLQQDMAYCPNCGMKSVEVEDGE